LAASVRPVHVIVEKIAQALAADCVFVGEPVQTAPDTARTIACWKDGRSVENVTYPAVSTPCEEIRPCSVVRHPLTGLGGALLGHIGVVSRRRLNNERRVRRVLASCAPRVAGEIERLRREQTRERLGGGPTFEAVSRGHDLLESLSEGDARMSTLALIHAHSCESPNGASLDMRAFVDELVANVRRSFVGPIDVVTRLRVDRLLLRLDLATPCGLVISELITNAFRHAFVGLEHGAIDVILTSDGHDVALTVRDDGVGLNHAEGEETKGMGLRLVRLLATRQLRGRLFISARQGTEVVVRFPMSTPPRPALRRSR